MAADFLKTDYLFLAVGVVGAACSDVEQTFVQVTKFSKREQLLDLLKTTGTSLSLIHTFSLFTYTQHDLHREGLPFRSIFVIQTESRSASVKLHQCKVSMYLPTVDDHMDAYIMCCK